MKVNELVLRAKEIRAMLSGGDDTELTSWLDQLVKELAVPTTYAIGDFVLFGGEDDPLDEHGEEFLVGDEWPADGIDGFVTHSAFIADLGITIYKLDGVGWYDGESFSLIERCSEATMQRMLERLGHNAAEAEAEEE